VELLRRLFRPLLGGTPLYRWAARLANDCSVALREGPSAVVRLRRLHLAAPGGPPVELRFRSLRKPICVRPGSDDVETAIQNIVRGEWGRFREPRSPTWIVDAGAYIGDTAAYFLSRFPEARLVALEPNAESYALAARNLAAYGARAVLLREGLWSSEGSLASSGRSTSAFLGVEGETVAVTTVDALLRRFEIPRIDILKLDVEGSEAAILGDEAHEWLSRVDLLLLEPHGADGESRVRATLRRAGFRISRYRSVLYCRRRQRPDDPAPSTRSPD